MYRPSQRPSFRLRMFPSPFARLFGMVSAPFATNNTVTKGAKLPESRTVIRKLSFAPRSRAALSLPIAAQFLRCRGTLFFGYSGAFFGWPRSLFSLTTAAQNIHVFLRESSLHKKHFFEWLKTADSSTACGMSTLKSPPPQAFSVSDVHPRLRKCPPGCTLDCGFKTAESPALRGFVAGAAGACDCGPLSCTKIERLSSLRKPPCKVRFFVQNRSRKYRPKVTVTTLFPTVSHPAFQLLAQTDHVCCHRRKWVHTRLSEKDRTQGLTRRNTGRFGWGRYYYHRSVPHLSETLRGRGLKRQTLPLLGLGRGYSRRTQKACGTAMRMMRVAVPQASRPRWAA